MSDAISMPGVHAVGVWPLPRFYLTVNGGEVSPPTAPREGISAPDAAAASATG